MKNKKKIKENKKKDRAKKHAARDTGDPEVDPFTKGAVDDNATAADVDTAAPAVDDETVEAVVDEAAPVQLWMLRWIRCLLLILLSMQLVLPPALLQQYPRSIPVLLSMIIAKQTMWQTMRSSLEKRRLYATPMKSVLMRRETSLL